MRALQANKYGGSEVLVLNEKASTPIVGENQILVDIHAASINPFDVKLLSGTYKDMIPMEFPYTFGGDFSGITKTGDEVYGTATVLNGGTGSFAEQAAANTENLSTKPKNLSFIEAAAIPLTGSSAIQAIEDHIGIKPGQKILIHGGAGGIGHIAIQLAKSFGAFVATTVNAKDRAPMKELGVDKIIDYNLEKFDLLLKGYDAVFDTVGGEITARSFNVLKPGGILVSMLGQPDADLATKFAVRVIGQQTKVNSKTLSRLTHYIETKKPKIIIDQTFDLSESEQALTRFETHPLGKIVFKIN